MKTIKYLLSCIMGVVDTWVGVPGSKGSNQDDFIGLASVGFVVAVFALSILILFKMNEHKKVNITSKAQLIGLGIAITILVILLICVVLIVGEKILQ